MKQQFKQDASKPATGRNRRGFEWFCAICLFLIFLVACGNDVSSSSATSESPSPIQACELLVKADVEAIIGSAVGEPLTKHMAPEDSNSWMSMCNYFSDEKSIGVSCLIKPHGWKLTGADAFARHEAELNEGLGTDTHMAVVDDMGDYAGWDEGSRQLTVFHGPYMLIISAGGRDVQGPAALSLCSRIARKVLGKLPQ